MTHELGKNAARDLILHRIEMKKKVDKKKKKNKRIRSDLFVSEFGASIRNHDMKLAGQNLSPHWNKGKSV